SASRIEIQRLRSLGGAQEGERFDELFEPGPAKPAQAGRDRIGITALRGELGERRDRPRGPDAETETAGTNGRHRFLQQLADVLAAGADLVGRRRIALEKL